MSTQRSIVWFKRDLRIRDHEPLLEAAAQGPVAGLYVYEPDVYQAAEHAPAHWLFINQCLHPLRQRLRELGSELLLRHGSMPEVLDRLREELPFDTLWSHQETGLDATYARDRRVKAWCRQKSVRWVECRQHGVQRPLRSRDGWSKLWHDDMTRPPLAAPSRLEPFPELTSKKVTAGDLLTADTLRLGSNPMQSAQPGGMQEAKTLLDSFLNERGQHYQKAMSSPVDGWDACSRLSPHLAYGTLSVRQAFHASLERRYSLKGVKGTSTWQRSLASFEKRLRWQGHFMQKLEDEPAIEFFNFNRAYDDLRQEDPAAWTEEERQRFEAWRQGRTGYPMVDACMRCLRETGWINFRMRAMLVSFAAYHLWLHWRPVAIELARRFLDFEPGIHYSQCQMQSGVTGINTVRIYSPIKQVLDQDPEGIFIRRWVPELEQVPKGFLSQPETMPLLTQQLAQCEIGVDYPPPIVDHKTAYHGARERIFAVRRTQQAKQEAQRVYQKHGSRRRPRRPALAGR